MENIAAGDHHTMHHSHQEESEDEDTLSFCDLPIYGSDPSEWDNEDQSLSSSFSSSSDQDCFEFYSEDWSTSSITALNNSYPVHQNIVFCGKIIPFKDLPVSNTPNNSPIKEESTKKRWIFRWKSMFSRKPRSKRQPKLGCDSSAKSLSMPTSGKYGGIALWGAPGLTSPAKFRWLNLLMFGLERLPEETDLSDNKTKQQSPARSNRCPNDRVRSGKVSWGIIGALGCGSYNQHRLHHQHQPCPIVRD